MEKSLPAMGHPMVRGGGCAVVEVTTFFPARCLYAIRTRKKFLKISKEDDKESLDL